MWSKAMVPGTGVIGYIMAGCHQLLRRRGLFVWLILASFLCVSLQLDYGHAESETDDTVVSAKPTPLEILRNIFAGLAQGDFSKYSRDFTQQMKASQTREAFLTLQKKVQSTLGKLKSLHYLGTYTQRGNLINLFKANFTKEKDDVLIKLVLDAKRSKPLVTGLWLDSPALEK